MMAYFMSKLARTWHTVVWSNTTLEAAVKVFFRGDPYLTQ